MFSFAANMSPVAGGGGGGNPTSSVFRQDWRNRLDIGNRRRMLMMAIARTQNAEKSKLFQLLSRAEMEDTSTELKIKSPMYIESKPIVIQTTSQGPDNESRRVSTTTSGSASVGVDADERVMNRNDEGLLNYKEVILSRQAALRRDLIRRSEMSSLGISSTAASRQKGTTLKESTSSYQRPSSSLLFVHRPDEATANFVGNDVSLHSPTLRCPSDEASPEFNATKMSNNETPRTRKQLHREHSIVERASVVTTTSPKSFERSSSLKKDQHKQPSPPSLDTNLKTESEINMLRKMRLQRSNARLATRKRVMNLESGAKATSRMMVETRLQPKSENSRLPISSPRRWPARCPVFEDDDMQVDLHEPSRPSPSSDQNNDTSMFLSPHLTQVTDFFENLLVTHPSCDEMPSDEDEFVRVTVRISDGGDGCTSFPIVQNHEECKTLTIHSSTGLSEVEKDLKLKNSLDSNMKASTTFFGKLLTPKNDDWLEQVKVDDNPQALFDAVVQGYQILRSISPRRLSSRHKEEECRRINVQLEEVRKEIRPSENRSNVSNGSHNGLETERNRPRKDRKVHLSIDNIESKGSNGHRSSVSLHKSSSDSIVASFEELISDLSKIIDDEGQITVAEEVLSEIRRTTKDAQLRDRDLEDALERMQTAVERMRHISGTKSGSTDAADKMGGELPSTKTPLHANIGKKFNFDEADMELSPAEADFGSNQCGPKDSLCHFDQENMNESLNKRETALKRGEHQKMTRPEPGGCSDAKLPDKNVQQKLGELLDGKLMFQQSNLNGKFKTTSSLSSEKAKDPANCEVYGGEEISFGKLVSRSLPAASGRRIGSPTKERELFEFSAPPIEDTESTESEETSFDDSTISSPTSHQVPREVICTNDSNSIIDTSTYSIGSNSVVSANVFGVYQCGGRGRKMGVGAKNIVVVDQAPATRESNTSVLVAMKNTSTLCPEGLSDVFRNPSLLCRCTGPVATSLGSFDDELVLKERLLIKGR